MCSFPDMRCFSVRNSDGSGRSRIALNCSGFGELGVDLVFSDNYPSEPCSILPKLDDYDKRTALRNAAHEHCSGLSGEPMLDQLVTWLVQNVDGLLCDAVAAAG